MKSKVLPVRKLAAKAFVSSLIYVGLGTLAVLCVYPPFYGDWVLLLLLVTFPVSILGLGVFYAGKYVVLVLFVQLIMFLMCWWLSYRYLVRRAMRNRKD